MSETPQEPEATAQDGGYGYPTLEQEVTPEVLEGDAASAGSRDSTSGDTEPAEDSGEREVPTPGEVEADPSPVEPTD